METTEEHSKMVTDLAKDGSAILASMTPMDMHILHMAVGIAGEAGELMDAIAIPVDMENVMEELGDFEFYAEGFRQGYAIKRYETLTDATHHHAFADGFEYCKNRARGLSIASTDLLDLVKKAVFYRKDVPLVEFIERLTDIEFHIEGLRQHFNITREESLNHNIIKLSKGDGTTKPRYGAEYSDEAANNRADKA